MSDTSHTSRSISSIFLRQGRSYDLGKMDLPQLWKAYLTYPTINLYMVLILCSIVAVIYSFDGWMNILLPTVIMLVGFPVIWYILHRFVLHSRILYKNKWTARTWKRIHFDHHQDPHLLEVLFGSPVTTLPTIAIIAGPIGYFSGGLSGIAAAIGVSLYQTCWYEFFHCIQHLNYKPRSKFVQLIKQRHLLHHFHDENWNQGITNFIPDILVGSYFRSAKEGPKSPTVFNLGYDLEEAKRYPWVMQMTGAPPKDKPDGDTSQQKYQK
ncbi:sterol desaturase family protein [Entomobacter blattae]|uniref:Fatty acid hydroxylase superfamily protein n=1 Tax=Entomobacter blattae TaxID=2762277 RepID=A0A7H1NPA4_9PROT|nr:sterol desaturase family protein [Entomobacter blattae]QNT77614.1 Fatty acid hydroxylase superfamily protein [Entomobacter blattae]